MLRLIVLLVSCVPLLSFGQGVVVVELFTSQGCSSCPAADRNLTEILKESEKSGANVLALSFHVDYWDYIGWKDPYSSKDYTDRQKMYASVMNLSSIYTPQMIVNGETEFVGSNALIARKAIKQALQETPSVNLSISKLVKNGEEWEFDFDIQQKKIPEGYLQVALVDRNVENFVPRGENTGKQLHHDNVVRAFTMVEMKKTGHIKIKAPGDLSESSSLIIYAQDPAMKLLGATSIRLK